MTEFPGRWRFNRCNKSHGKNSLEKRIYKEGKVFYYRDYSRTSLNLPTKGMSSLRSSGYTENIRNYCSIQSYILEYLPKNFSELTDHISELIPTDSPLEPVGSKIFGPGPGPDLLIIFGSGPGSKKISGPGPDKIEILDPDPTGSGSDSGSDRVQVYPTGSTRHLVE